MVRLKGLRFVDKPRLKAYFNSIMVRLKGVHLRRESDSKPHFNSIMVRLKVSVSQTITFAYNIFQFHNGTIKSRFQMQVKHSEQYFNSIMVRLKEERG